MSITEIVSRVQELQSRFGTATVAGTATGGTTATRGAAFAAALGAASGSYGTGATGGTGGTGPTGSTGGSGGVTGDEVVAAARKYLGVPYVFGSANPANGLDCSGLVQRVYKDLGIKLPRLSWEQAKSGTAVHGLANARPGDILGFNGNSHVAIYIGNGKMIAAPQPGEKVKIQNVYATPSAIRRVLPDAPATGSGPVLRPTGLTPKNSTGLSGVPYGDLFTRAGAKYGVSPKLLAAVAKVESGYNPRAVSPAGARGLMQIMPGTARGLGVNPMDPAQAVDGAARLLARNIKTFDSVPLALAAYNAGAGAVRKYGGIPPYAETQAYVPKVLRAMAALG